MLMSLYNTNAIHIFQKALKGVLEMTDAN